MLTHMSSLIPTQSVLKDRILFSRLLLVCTAHTAKNIGERRTLCKVEMKGRGEEGRCEDGDRERRGGVRRGDVRRGDVRREGVRRGGVRREGVRRGGVRRGGVRRGKMEGGGEEWLGEMKGRQTGRGDEETWRVKKREGEVMKHGKGWSRCGG